MRHEIRALDIADTDSTAGEEREIRHFIAPTLYIHQVAGGDAFDYDVQVKISSEVSATPVAPHDWEQSDPPDGPYDTEVPPNPTNIDPPVTNRTDQAPEGPDTNDHWITFAANVIAPTMLALAASSGAPLPISHVRILRNTLAAGTKPPYVCVAGFNARTE